MTVRRPAVVGAGAMGTGIALAFANAGFPVRLIEKAPSARERAAARLARAGVSVPLEDDMRAASTADLVVEAVFEDLALKRSIFAELSALCGTETILASNTSSLDVDAIGAQASRPERILGMHFSNPAHVNKMLEIVRGARTSAATIRTAVEIGRRLGKVPVVVGNCDGFVASRTLFAYFREAEMMAIEGANVADVDHALVAFGMPMGPFAMVDLAGIDVAWSVREMRRRGAGYPYRLGGLVDALYAAGRYGQKSGAGFYRYESGRHEPLSDDAVAALAAAERTRCGVALRAHTDEEIVRRTILAAANEGAEILRERIAERASDIDTLWVYGFGFPARRGGPMAYADGLGLEEVLRFVRERARDDPAFWRPSPLLEELVAAKRTFAACASS